MELKPFKKTIRCGVEQSARPRLLPAETMTLCEKALARAGRQRLFDQHSVRRCCHSHSAATIALAAEFIRER